jgi:fructose-1,6-bisphosphatase II
VDIRAPVQANLAAVARAKGETIHDLTVVILDRPRHEQLITEVRRCGARIRLIPDGDVAGAFMTALPESGIDVLMGTGGTPEGVLAACALRAMGGNLVGRLSPRNDEERRLGAERGIDFARPLTIEDLVASEDVFFAATGITNGEMLRGVNYFAEGASTDSLVVRGLTGTTRRILSNHRLSRLNLVSEIEY